MQLYSGKAIDSSKILEEHLKSVRLLPGGGKIIKAFEAVMGERSENLVRHLGSISIGAHYIYTAELPHGCKGNLYFLHRFVMDVPAYQKKVLMEALTGKDKGLWFVCSEWNMSTRYRRATAEEVQQYQETLSRKED